MGTRYQVKGHLAAFFTIFVWGTTYISTKVLLLSFAPIEIMFFRLVLAVLALSIVSPPKFQRNDADHAPLRGEWKTMLAGFFGVTLYFMLQNIALTHTLAANVSVLISIAPLLIALVSRVLLRDQLMSGFFIGFITAMAGIILITYNGSFVLKLNPLGDILSLLAALAWAFYSVLIKVINAPQSEVLNLTRKIFSYGFLFLIPALPLFDFHLGWESFVSAPNLLNLLFLGVVASAVCFATWNYAVQELGPVTTSIYIYLGPVITIITSALVLRETITPIAGIGMALILTGMVLSERRKAAQPGD
jgi:drug/metabolite transporter (DMT)-like permease